MTIQVGDIFTASVYTGEFWYVIEKTSTQTPYFYKFQQITRTPPLKYFGVDEIILRKGVKQAKSFLNSEKFHAVKLNGEIKDEKLYLRFMELLLKMGTI